MARRQHAPRRTCLGCGARDDRGQLIRLRAGAQGELIADNSRAGRGGYLHCARECWEKFLRRKSVYRAFHRDIAKSEKVKLVQELMERHGE
ncbi:MAG TPA: YlxR family protein [Candidatus Binatia bacterium]